MSDKHLAVQKLQQAMASQQGDLQSAKTLLIESMAIFQMLEDHVHLAETYLRLGEIMRMSKDTVQAYAMFEKAGDLSAAAIQQVNEQLAHSLHARAVIFAENGKLGESFIFLSHAAMLYQDLASPRRNEVMQLIQRIRDHVGPAQAANLDQFWNHYQQALVQGRQQQMHVLQLNVSG
jgi:tetratricopeptide (TPR) repeat protein